MPSHAAPALPAELANELHRATTRAHKLWFEPQHQAYWFASTPQFDAELRAGFGDLLEALADANPQATSQ